MDIPTALSTRFATRLKKRTERALYNLGVKVVKADVRQKALIELGKTVIVTEKDGVKTYAFPPEPVVNEVHPPRLSWLGGKTFPQGGDSRKNRSHFGPEHREAFVENASRVFAKQIDTALMPPVPITDPARLLTAGIPHSDTQVAI
jgi:hypothetical protein